jgi:hypothetical protein
MRSKATVPVSIIVLLLMLFGSFFYIQKYPGMCLIFFGVIFDTVFIGLVAKEITSSTKMALKSKIAWIVVYSLVIPVCAWMWYYHFWLLILPLNFIMIRVYFAFVRKKFIPKERIEDTITFDAF